MANNQQPTIIPVVLAGGVGSRLWPLSREAHPKPFIKLDDGQSLIQKTYLHALAATACKDIITVINRDLFFTAKDEYDELKLTTTKHTYILEPVGRNSSAAIALAAHYATKEYENDCILLVFPADQLIAKPAAFASALAQAASLASQDKLVTFGIKPDSPKTGYGYIEADGHCVKRFIEKPPLEAAESYLAAGNYYWNSGIFCFKASTILDEMQTLCPDIAVNTQHCLTTAKKSSGNTWCQLEINHDSFAEVPHISIDYAVFEKSKKVAIVPCDIGWSDIGSWQEFGELLPSYGTNHIQGEAVVNNTNGCVILAENRLVATLGLTDLIIADTTDALLIAHKSQCQQVRHIVNQLKKTNDHRYHSFPTVHRPWGSYTVLQETQNFKIKQLDVKPGASLSLQSHQHRNEHWVVVSGIAKITTNNATSDLQQNQSTYIPAGCRHRLENKQEQTLVLIEIQCGTYLGEDDIIRHEGAGNKQHSEEIPL